MVFLVEQFVVLVNVLLIIWMCEVVLVIVMFLSEFLKIRWDSCCWLSRLWVLVMILLNVVVVILILLSLLIGNLIILLRLLEVIWLRFLVILVNGCEIICDMDSQMKSFSGIQSLLVVRIVLCVN